MNNNIDEIYLNEAFVGINRSSHLLVFIRIYFVKKKTIHHLHEKAAS